MRTAIASLSLCLAAATASAQPSLHTAASQLLIPASGTLDLDVNGDGVTDISFFNLPDCPSGGFIRVNVPAQGGGVAAQNSDPLPFAAPVHISTEVGPALTYAQSANLITCGFEGVNGAWASPNSEGFLGVKLILDGQVHYAEFFIRHHNSGAYAIVQGAYENTPDAPVFTRVYGDPCGDSDFNNDGDTGTDSDIEDFFRCISGDCCLFCDTADIDQNGDFGTDNDIEWFFRILMGAGC
jgi:hypothetical protein